MEIHLNTNMADKRKQVSIEHVATESKYRAQTRTLVKLQTVLTSSLFLTKDRISFLMEGHAIL